MKRFIRIINPLIIAVACAFFLPACYDMFDFQAPKKTESEEGTFSLVIGNESASRTILPNATVNSFDTYSLVFTPAVGTAITVSPERTNTNLNDPITLPVGTYTLTVKAKKSTVEVAEGTLAGIEITNGGSTSKTLNLTPIVAGTGTFTWNITYPATVSAATMTINPLPSGTALTPVDLLLSGSGSNSTLASGYYKVVFDLTSTAVSIVWVEYLHIYQGLTSTYTYAFTPAHFGETPADVAVTGITGIPTRGAVGNLTLAGEVAPSNATHQTIAWSVKTDGGTNASISGNTVTTTAAGTLVVTATIEDGTAAGTDYTQDFSIVFIVPVTGITDIPTELKVGTSLTLSGTVAPSNATNNTIVWSVKTDGGTNASISGSTVSTTATGTLVVTATITGGTVAGNYTQDFSIDIKNFGITLSPDNSTYNPYIITSSGQTVIVSNAAGNGATGPLTLALTGADTGSFDLSSSPLASINAGANASFTVTPKASLTTGTHLATVTVSNTANGISASLNVSYTVSGSISINFEIINNAPVIPSIPSTLSIGADDIVSLTATGTFNTIRWEVNGDSKGTGQSFDLKATDYTKGTYSLSVVGTLTNGASYNSEPVTFTVTD